MGRYNSDYKNYKELIWVVIEVALKKGFEQAFNEVLSFESFTRSEILDVANVTMEEYKEDCFAAYNRELEIRKELCQEAYND